MSSTEPGTQAATGRSTDRNPFYSALVGLTTLGILLQAVWAGIFLEHDGERDQASNWIDVHAIGSHVVTVLALLATIVAVAKLRARRDLWIGTLVLTLLLIVESYLGGLIRDSGKDALTAVHVPLAMAIMGLAVWLPVRAAARRQLGQVAPAQLITEQ